MRITRDPTRETAGANDADSRPQKLLGAGLLLLTFSLGFLIAHLGWHHPLIEGVTHFIRQPAATAAALLHPPDLPTLTLDLAFRDYDRLLQRREQALRLGVHGTTGEEPVPATISTADAAVEVDLRLPPGPAQPLAGETWPLEAHVQGDGTLLGLRRFLLRPAREDAVQALGYLETLRRAGHLVPRAQVVHLIVNGSERGRYLLLEQPGAEMLAAHDCPDCVLVAFDPSAYWATAGRLGQALPGSGFQYAQVTLIPPPDTVDAPLSAEAIAARHEAFDLLERLRHRAAQPSDVLDVERTASLLAMTALWYGTPEVDWRGLTFAYDPTSGRLEPVAPPGLPASLAPLPDRVLDDATIRLALVRTLRTLSQPDALAQLQADLAPQMESFQQALGTATSPWETLAAHQTVIRRQIAPSPILFATLYPGEAGLTLRLDNAQPFPVVIVGLDLGENLFLPIDPSWVVEPEATQLVGSASGVVIRAAVDSMPRTVYLEVPPEALDTGAPPGAEVGVVARLLGLGTQHRVIATPGLEPEGSAP